MGTITAIRPSVKPIRIFGEGVLPVPTESQAWNQGLIAGGDGLPCEPDAWWPRSTVHAFTTGHAAGLVKFRAKGVPATPTSASPVTGRTDADRAWKLGFDLGRDGVNALAPSEWCEVLKDSFYRGVGDGEQQRDADMEATFRDHLDMVEAFTDVFANCWEGGAE